MQKETRKTVLVVVIIIILVFFVIALYNFFSSRDKVKLSSEEIQTINDNFTSYEGSRNGIQVKQLLDKLVSYNKNADKKTQVDLDAKTLQDTRGNHLILGEINGKYIDLKNDNVLNPNKLYKISFEYTSSGRINVINIGT